MIGNNDANHISDDDLVLFALQLLPDERMTQAMSHLQACEACRSEVAKIQGDLAAYSMTAPPEPPPAGSRDRFMRQIAREPRINELPAFDLKPTEYELRQAEEVRQAEKARQTEKLTLTPHPESPAPIVFDERAPDRLQERFHERFVDRVPDRSEERAPERLHDRVQDHPHESLSDRAGDRLQDRVRDRAEDYARDRVDNRFEDRSIDRVEDRTRDRAENRFDDRSRDRDEDRARERIENRFDDRSRDRVEDHGRDRIEDRAEERGRDRRVEARAESSLSGGLPLPDRADRLPDRRSSPRSESVFSHENRILTRGSRLGDDVNLEVYREERRTPRRLAPWVLAWTGWAIAAGCSFVAGLQLHQRQQMQGAMTTQQARIDDMQKQAVHGQQAQDALSTLTAANAMQIALHSDAKPVAATKGAPPVIPPEALAAYLADKGALVFVATHMAPTPAGKTYELWLLPANGQGPIPAGTFKPDAQGSASVVMPRLPKGVQAKGFGVTVENDGGSPTPTLPIVMS